jgi:hypothetical protein
MCSGAATGNRCSAIWIRRTHASMEGRNPRLSTVITGTPSTDRGDSLPSKVTISTSARAGSGPRTPG